MAWQGSRRVGRYEGIWVVRPDTLGTGYEVLEDSCPECRGFHLRALVKSLVESAGVLKALCPVAV